MARIRFITLASGHQLAVGVDGEGPTVICPAWWTSHLEEDAAHPPFQAFLEAFAEHGRIVRYDRLGAGLSDRVLPEPTLEGEIATLLEVADAVGAERFSLLGISLGAPVALAVAARHPERIERVAVCGSFADGSGVASANAQEAMVGVVLQHWGMGVRALADLFVPGLSHEERKAFAERQKASADAETAATLLRFTYRIDVRALLPEVQAPVLVLHRRGDRAIPYAQGRSVAARLPEATWTLLEGDAHPPWEGAGIVEELVGFLFPPGEEDASGWTHDRDLRALVVDGERVALTKLEHGLLVALEDRAGAVATRDELLEEVWEQRFAGSNVVEAVVRTLRRKLGRHAGAVETVVGHGYRLSRE